MITIKTKDGETIQADENISNMIGLFKTILQDYSINEPIELKSVSKADMLKIIKFCEHHSYVNPQPISKPIKSNDLYSFVVDRFDADFISEFDFSEVFNLINICEFLDIGALKDLAFARIAAEFKGKLE